MELSKEHFDQVVSGLATKADLQNAVAPLATKLDVRDAVEELARMISAGFERSEERFSQLDDRLDLSAELEMYQRKFEKIEEALQIKF